MAEEMTEVKGSVGCYDKIPPPQGLKDGGHVILKCSSCDKPLIDIWVVKPEFSIEHIYQALCCYCGDKSFQMNIRGRVAVSPISKPNPNDEDDFIPVTLWSGVRTADGVSLFLTKEP